MTGLFTVQYNKNPPDSKDSKPVTMELTLHLHCIWRKHSRPVKRNHSGDLVYHQWTSHVPAQWRHFKIQRYLSKGPVCMEA